MNSEELRDLIVDALEDLKARDIKALDVRHLTTITDYMVIASGTSDRHVKSIADRVIERAQEAGIRPYGVEGQEKGDWILVDLQDALVHVMQPDTRDFYNLEKLWDISSPRSSAASTDR
ncbi:MAG: ribosome silencing factor [Gammaproteobacteria bacterium]|jgi:ribosome-associated protein